VPVCYLLGDDRRGAGRFGGGAETDSGIKCVDVVYMCEPFFDF
jgi:hypothetical protein